LKKILFRKKVGDIIDNLKDNTDIPEFVRLMEKHEEKLMEYIKKL
jgi:ribosomal protein L39E